MDLSESGPHRELRAAVRAFLADWPPTGDEATLPLEEQERRFRERGIERGYVYRGIPKRYGGSEQPDDPLAELIIAEEYAAAGAPGNLLNQGAAMLAPTLIEFGSEAQRERFVPPTLRGDMLWCQGYSEPNSGSDLASLACSARLDGDQWVIHGQKIWTSNAREADWMFGLFRTEPDAPKHAGISYLLVPLDQPGIDIRPLEQMTGGDDFNEVFFDGARTDADLIVGQRGEGWGVSRATLRHERNMIGDPNLTRGWFNALLRLAREARIDGRPALEHAHVRQRLVEIEERVRCQETSNLRQLSAFTSGKLGDVALPMMMNKLYSTDIWKALTALAWDLLGSDGLLAPTEADTSSYGLRETPSGWVEQYMFALGSAIGGGASNIQRNIIGERGLGLPRDLRRG